MKRALKIIISLITFVLILFFCLALFYMKGLPLLVSNQKVINFVQNTVKETINANLTIEKPVLKTDVLPLLKFKAYKISLSKDKQILLDIYDLDLGLSFKDIFKKKIILDKLTAESVFADINSLMDLAPQNTEKKEKKSNWGFEIDDSILGVQSANIMYSINPDTLIDLRGEGIKVDNTEKIRRGVLFNLFAKVMRGENSVDLALSDNNNVYFYDKKFHVEHCPLSINNSAIFIDLLADKKQNFDINLYSDNFNLQDILDFLDTQVIENKVSDSLVYFSDIKGNLDFKLNIKKDDLNGNFKINNLSAKIRDVDNIPVTLSQGNIDLTSDEIKLSGFEGYYDNNEKNKIKFEGTVKDYLKSIDTDIVADASVRNDI